MLFSKGNRVDAEVKETPNEAPQQEDHGEQDKQHKPVRPGSVSAHFPTLVVTYLTDFRTTDYFLTFAPRAKN